MNRRTLLAVLGLTCLATLPAGAQTVPAYTFVDLGSLRGKGSTVSGINAAGQISGTGYYEPAATAGRSNSRAFRIDPLDTNGDTIPDTWFVPDGNGFNSRMLLFSLPGSYKWSEALGINAAGAVAGQMLGDGYTTPQNTFYGAPDGTGVQVSTEHSWGRGVNDSGTVVGAIFPKGGKTAGAESPTIWRLSNGSFTATNLGIEALGHGRGINNLDQVTGTDGNIGVAYLWLPSPAYGLPAGKTSLGTFVGGTTSYGWAINDSGHVVGYARGADGYDRAFLWAPPTDGRFATPGVLTDLTAGSSWASSYAYALNNPAPGAPLLAVGEGKISTDRWAPFVWDSDRRQMRDLSLLTVNPPQRAMEKATGINAQGWIVGNYRYLDPIDGKTYSRGFLLLPNATLPDASVVPAGVTGLSGSASAGLASLAWTDGAGEHGLKIDRSTDGTNWTQIASLPADAIGHADSAALQGMSYTYRVVPFNVAGYAPAAQTSVTTPGVPLAPTIGTASALSATSVRVRWTNNSNTQSSVSVERSTNASFSSVVTSSASGTATQLDLTGLTGNTTYYFRVRSQNGVGYSAYSGTATVTTPRR